MFTVSPVDDAPRGIVAAREEVMTTRRTEGILAQEVSMLIVPLIWKF
jgi:hypothetical protein